MAERPIATDLNLLGNALRNATINPVDVQNDGLPTEKTGAMFYSLNASTTTYPEVSDGTKTKGTYNVNKPVEAGTLYVFNGDIWLPVASGSSIDEIKEKLSLKVGDVWIEDEDGTGGEELQIAGRLTFKEGQSIHLEAPAATVPDPDDKTKTIPAGMVKISVTVDDTLDSQSTNPVQNKAVKDNLDGTKAALSSLTVSVSPRVFLVGQAVNFTITAIPAAKPDMLLGSFNGAPGTAMTSSSPVDGGAWQLSAALTAANNATAKSYPITVSAEYGSHHKMNSTSARAVLPYYVFVGQDAGSAVDAGTKIEQRALENCNQFGEFTINAGDTMTYVWILVPSGMPFNGMTLSGFDFPFDKVSDVIKTGYTTYKSNSKQAGALTPVKFK